MAPNAVVVPGLAIHHGGVITKVRIEAGSDFRVALQTLEAPAPQSQFVAGLALGNVVECSMSGGQGPR